jgi:MarR family transcriptional regulator, negative regulator of the multidrug operon emrRAB
MPMSFSYFEQNVRRVLDRLPGAPYEQIVLTRLFFHVFRGMEAGMARTLAPYGLNTNTFLALVMMYGSEENKVHPCELSDALISSRTNITRLADELVKAGWVERRASTEDRRRVELSLTPAGQALLEEVIPRNREVVTQLWTGFSAGEVAEFDRLLRKLLGNIDEDTNAAPACAG